MSQEEKKIEIRVGNSMCTLVLDKTHMSFLIAKEALAILRNSLKFKVDNVKYATAGSAWDGTVYKITARGEFATGFLPFCCKILIANGFIIKLTDLRENVVTFIKDPEYLKKLGDDVLADHQLSSVMSAINYTVMGMPFPRGVLDIATNGGKTHISAKIIELASANRVIFTVHKESLVAQTVENYLKIFPNDVSYVLSTTQMPPKARIVVCMYKTLSNRVKTSERWMNWFLASEMLIVDECHRARGAELSSLIELSNAYCKYLMSGTPFDYPSKLQKAEMVGLSGSTLVKIENKELIGKGWSTPPVIYMYYNNKGFFANGYADMTNKNLKFNEDRNNIILDVVKKNQDIQGIIVTNKIAHARHLSKYLSDRLKWNVPWISGQHKDRWARIEQLKSGSLKCLIVTDILKEGDNIPTLDYIVLVAGGKDVIFVKQTIGRILRIRDGKVEGKIYDIYDDFKYLKDHSEARIKTYVENSFEIKPMSDEISVKLRKRK